MRKQVSESVESFNSPPLDAGAFMPDGSYRPDLGWSAQGPAHNLVRALVRRLRADRLTPPEAASIVHNANVSDAFPWLEQWGTCSLWPLVWTATSAEEAVKRAGRGAEGHWCGQAWGSRPEKSCDDPRHRDYPKAGEVSALVQTVLQHLASAPSLPVRGKTPPIPTPTTPPDESWPGWAAAGFQP